MVFHQSKHRAGGDAKPPPGDRRQFFGVYQYSGRALALVWQTSRGLTITLGLLTLTAGILPAAVAYVGKLIVDSVVLAIQNGSETELQRLLGWVALEGLIVALLAGAQRGIEMCQSLLRALLGQKVNVMILEKALTLELAQFEDSEFYDSMTRARRDASSRPLSLVTRTFSLIQNGISLITYGGLLIQFSPLAVLVLFAAGIPAFIAETKFSGEAFRLFRWRAPETRRRAYLEMVLAREDYAKEVQLYDLGPLLLDRYKHIFESLYREDRNLTLKRGFWGYGLGLLSTLAFYGAYAWIAWEAATGVISLGDMTMYLLIFKQGQSAFSAAMSAIGQMYEDNLYLSNLYEFLEYPSQARTGIETTGSRPGDGVRFENVTFTYPGSGEPAIQNISFHLEPGRKLALVGENGSGKTTIIKLLTRLYEPESGRILLDGRDIREWDRDVLRNRIGVIFQDFARYQMSIGENIGSGDVRAFEDRDRWSVAAERGMAHDMVERLPDRFDTQLGRWFENGRELSGGQWQKVALARAFMREDADILVLDEPTAAMDAAAEARIFQHFHEMTTNRMAILISHRFSTVRMADTIAVLEAGRIVELGDHESLMAEQGTYAYLFQLQARGYR
ncbi:ABC transporter ATP-binding protein [Sulfidibacter corallicola]|uniref:ABC transporter ATP-binding protein n=1 Tax=Sulfidibacter corallicola TaxID=2818388 RepID=A0A8A4TM73_SULCO|nr:ABC transporter ATP-binding protein [Sulfidibacter corallicola]QTD50304.1 ABC transporter ATP-binding protein [Sulfidibacter corallicola]